MIVGNMVLFTKGLNLARRSKTDIHELNFVHHPQTVVIEQAEIHWPTGAGGTVASIHRARKQHVLSTNQNCTICRMKMPIPGICSTHEEMYADFASMVGLAIPK